MGREIASGNTFLISKWLIAILLLGAVVRIAGIAWFHDKPVRIGDEKSYEAIAVNLAEQGEFARYAGAPISLRPPLYPGMLAGLYRVAGVSNHTAVRIVQACLGLLLVVLVYLLTKLLYDERTAIWAAAITCFYPSLLFFNNLLLTEMLFAVLVCLACLTLNRFLKTQALWQVAAVGGLLALAALTRSVLWLFPPLLILYLLWAVKDASWRKRIAAAAVSVAAFAVVVAPWSVRNTRLQKTFTAIDSMGGRNAMMGNYEHTPMFRAWDAISIGGDESWNAILIRETPGYLDMTQGQRDKVAMRRAVQFMLANPWLTAKRCVVKFFQFWQLERTLVAGMAKGYWGEFSTAAILLATLLVFGSFCVCFLTAVYALFVVPPVDRRMHVFLLLLILFIWAVHTGVFAHARYHVALMPLVFIYSGGALAHLATIWRRRTTWQFGLASLVSILFIVFWITEIVLVEWKQVQGMFS